MSAAVRPRGCSGPNQLLEVTFSVVHCPLGNMPLNKIYTCRYIFDCGSYGYCVTTLLVGTAIDEMSQQGMRSHQTTFQITSNPFC